MFTDTTPTQTAALRPMPGLRAWYTRFAKRAFDIAASVLGLIVLAPVFGVLAIMIKRASPGPVFFRGARMGRNGVVFPILKFRTMHENAESYAGPRVTAHGDGRVTPFGQWLRDSKINELPQLWNVLKGEMSLVGPRPEDPEIVAAWPEEARAEILSMRPGITSPASIAYHDEEKRLSPDNLLRDYMEKIVPDKLRLDRLYVRHHTFMTDLDAIFWTLIVLVPRVARYPRTEGQLFGGPFTRRVRPYLSWILLDFLIALAGAGGVGLVWRVFRPLNIGGDWALLVAFLLALQFGVFNSFFGLERVEWSRAAPEDVFGLFFSCALVAIVSTVVSVFVPKVNIPDGYILTVSFVVLVGFIVARYRLRLVTGLASRWVNFRAHGYGIGERVLVAGAGSGGEFATWLLRRHDFRRLFKLVGYVDDDPAKQGMRYDGISVLGTTADIPSLVQREDIGIVFYAIGQIDAQDRERILGSCRQANTRLVILSDVLQSLEAHFMPAQSRG
jgi:lipopolysaccharide/colanic/teichoic acid biosynthesis glycosyltransferase